MAELIVWVEGAILGTLEAREGLFGFSYHRDWLLDPERFALSPHFPLTEEAFRDREDHRPVRWFFDNLLPEGAIRQALARFAGIHEHDLFAFLARFGEESAGALTLLPPGKPFPREGRYQPLSREELRAMLARLPTPPLLAAQGRSRMSLAGAQHKLVLHRRGEELLLPDGAASSLILKPDHARVGEFPSTPANEHFCMTLARAAGLKVPRTELHHLPEPIYLVERYDRRLQQETVVRLHQIDLCQLLNRWPDYKYESDGGATLEQTFAALHKTRQPAVSRLQLLTWLIFNYLIGNSDAHAKNISFLVQRDGLELAPAYDLLSLRSYGEEYDQLAMTIRDEPRYGWIEWSHWKGLAERAGVKPSLVKRLLGRLSQSLPPLAREVHRDPAFTEDERVFLERVIEVIDRHAGYVQEAIGKK